MQALPPQHVLSATVTNTTEAAVSLVATYEMPNGQAAIVETLEIAAGAVATLAQKVVTEGQAQFTGHINKLSATAAGASSHELVGPFNGIASPTKDHKFAVSLADGALVIA
jgi:hypothetical protein